MTRARLVKQKELMERESATARPESPATINKAMADTVLEWKQGRQVAERLNPREVFAALFTPRRLTETCK